MRGRTSVQPCSSSPHRFSNHEEPLWSGYRKSCSGNALPWLKYDDTRSFIARRFNSNSTLQLYFCQQKIEKKKNPPFICGFQNNVAIIEISLIFNFQGLFNPTH